MSLAPGRRIGAYEIVSRLGAGGMGDVYRARDTRLGRDVALKILPPAFTGDSDRLLRFEREARVLAALNHPHIAAIFHVEHQDDIRAIVLELVEGETLANRIARGRMAPQAAIAIATQIADALDAAHEKGIVHRDLKPSNVALTSDGVVKVLDFGLATAPSSATSAEITHSPTMAFAGTMAGVVVGTAAYMSPEQARGQVVDKRTDIWAFGCVLYEMLTGRGAFGRTTASDTIAAVLEREPDWQALAGAPAFQRIVQHCLEKDVRARARDIADVRVALSHALETAPTAVERKSRTRVTSLVLAGVLAIVGADLLLRSWLTGRADRTIASPAMATLTRVTADEGVTADPAISRDGTLVAFATDRARGEDLDIWIQRSAGGVPIRLTDEPVDEHEPAISPDGSLIAFRSEREGGGIYVMPALGGEQPRLVAAGGRRPRFSPDGSAIAFWVGSNIGFTALVDAYRSFIVPLSGGAPTEIGAELTGIRYPVWSPDGRTILATATRSSPPELATYDWWLIPVGGGPAVEVGVRQVFRDAGINMAATAIWPEAWAENGVLFSDFRSIWSIGIDPAGRPTHPPERLTFGPSQDAQPSVSATGVTAFSSYSQSNHVWALPLDADRGVATGDPKRLSSGVGQEMRPSASTDGLQLLYRSATQNPTIHLRNLVSGRVIDAGVSGTAFGPALSPDGRWIAFESDDGVSVMASQGGPVRVLCRSCTIGDWTASSRGLLVVSRAGAAFSLIDVDTGTARNLLVSNRPVSRPFLSPDAEVLAFRLSTDAGDQMMVAPVPSSGMVDAASWKIVVPAEDDVRPAGWSPNSRLLYFVSARDGTRCLYAQRVSQDGVPEGNTISVKHFHGTRNLWANSAGVLSTGPANAVRGGSFFYDLATITSNIWTLSNRASADPQEP